MQGGFGGYRSERSYRQGQGQGQVEQQGKGKDGGNAADVLRYKPVPARIAS